MVSGIKRGRVLIGMVSGMFMFLVMRLVWIVGLPLIAGCALHLVTIQVTPKTNGAVAATQPTSQPEKRSFLDRLLEDI